MTTRMPPDYVDEYKYLAPASAEIPKHMEASIEKFKKLGVVHCRATLGHNGTLYLEGWKVKPPLDGETEPPA